MISTDEAIKAASLLNDFCREHRQCQDCPFNTNEGDCLISDYDIGLGWPLEHMEGQ